MINFELDDEQKLIRETVIAFARDAGTARIQARHDVGDLNSRYAMRQAIYFS